MISGVNVILKIPKTCISSFGITYIGLNASLQIFLVKTRWFSDKMRDSLNEVLMDLYGEIVFGSLCKNVCTSLYAKLPFDKTVL